MKGMDSGHVDGEVNRMVRALGLEPKRDAMAQTLSGGMKRKLCVGIALCAGSKVVLLDEPTSGKYTGVRLTLTNATSNNWIQPSA
jgi:ATP-binding cassette subfamily A (ABC1) protein 3